MFGPTRTSDTFGMKCQKSAFRVAPGADSGGFHPGFPPFSVSAPTVPPSRTTRTDRLRAYSAAMAAILSKSFSTCSAQSRPSRIAQTTSEAPRTMSPTA